MKNIFFALNIVEDISYVSQTRTYLDKRDVSYNLDFRVYNLYKDVIGKDDIKETPDDELFDNYYYVNILKILNNYHLGNHLLSEVDDCSGIKKTIIDTFQNINEYDLYCFSVYEHSLENWLLAALTLKTRNPDSNILFGGPEIMMNDYFDDIWVDLGIRYSKGDAEASIYKAITSDSIDCTSLVSMGELSADDVPKYTTDELIQSNYTITLNTSRGCPNKCKYCCTTNYTPYRVIKRSVVIQWIKYYNEIGVKYIKVNDPNLNLFKFEELLDGMIEINNKCEIVFCLIEFNKLSESIIRKMREAGVKVVLVGIEGIHGDLQKKINKKQPDRETLIRYHEIFEEVGIDVCLAYVYGFPGQTPDIFKYELDLLVYLKRFKNVRFDLYDFYFVKKSYMHDPDNFGEFGVTPTRNFKRLAEVLCPRYKDVFEKIYADYDYSDKQNIPEYRKYLRECILKDSPNSTLAPTDRFLSRKYNTYSTKE